MKTVHETLHALKAKAGETFVDAYDNEWRVIIQQGDYALFGIGEKRENRNSHISIYLAQIIGIPGLERKAARRAAVRIGKHHDSQDTLLCRIAEQIDKVADELRSTKTKAQSESLRSIVKSVLQIVVKEVGHVRKEKNAMPPLRRKVRDNDRNKNLL